MRSFSDCFRNASQSPNLLWCILPHKCIHCGLLSVQSRVLLTSQPAYFNVIFTDWISMQIRNKLVKYESLKIYKTTFAKARSSTASSYLAFVQHVTAHCYPHSGKCFYHKLQTYMMPCILWNSHLFLLAKIFNFCKYVRLSVCRFVCPFCQA